MKKTMATWVKMVMQQNWVWFFLKPIFRGIDWLAWYKYELYEDLRRRAEDRLKTTLFHSLTVLNGPFKGLSYVDFNSMGSAIYPKLLGSYECELHSVLTDWISKQDFREVLDIGCAEGYYAVGLALLCPRARIHAFDVDPKALEQCRKMVNQNHVEDRVVLGTAFHKQDFLRFDFSSPSLIFVDCEGFEKELFDPQMSEHLAQAFLIIEVHDFLDRGIFPYLVSCFEKTHKLKVIRSQDRRAADYAELKPFNGFQKELAMDEMRPERMRWLCISPLDGRN